MRPLLTIVLLLLLLAIGCQTATTATQDARQAAFITLLGDDTLAVERFEHTDDGMIADVVLRTPRTTIRRYEITFDDENNLQRYEGTIRTANGENERREVATMVRDSLLITGTQNGEQRETSVGGDGAMLPFIDMVHWPFEIALMRAVQTGRDSLAQPLFTSRGAMDFIIRNHGDGRMSMQHPFRGTMDVEVDAEGRLQHLDAGETTRALTVRRVPDVDIDAIAERFAAEDEAGRPFGALSGRGETETQVDGATISVDYGQPAKRGRDIWGGLVSWGELWRTGANRATHIETDRTLRIGDLVVPAGTYTLFSVPEPDGGTLIINSQTGQNGNSYDASQDFGRVQMEARPLSESVELFTIAVDDVAEGGELKLQWDQTEFVVPFTVE